MSHIENPESGRTSSKYRYLSTAELTIGLQRGGRLQQWLRLLELPVLSQFAFTGFPVATWLTMPTRSRRYDGLGNAVAGSADPGCIPAPSGINAAGYNSTERSLSELAMTETELRLIAAPAIIGLKRIPKNG